MILCFGTTPTVQQTMTFSRVEVDEVNRAINTFRHASGKPVNVARVLHILGVEAKLCVPLGGEMGRFMEEDLRKAGVRMEAVTISGSTRLCVTVIDRAIEASTEFVEEHPPVTSAELAEIQRVLFLHLPAAQMLVLSGTLGTGLDESLYENCCKAANTLSVPVILDAKGGPLIRALASCPLVVKPNRAELSATVGHPLKDDASLKSAMKDLQSRGPKWVIITLGTQGAVATEGSEFWKIPALQIDAHSPIGSGDSFTAGLAAGIVAGQEVPEACKRATACAAANALIPGSGLLRAEDVRRFESMVQIEPF